MPTSREAYIRYVRRRMESQGYPAYVIRRAIRAINDDETYREEWAYGKWFPYYYNSYKYDD